MTNAPERCLPGVADQLQKYVYLLIDPTSGKPFYVGKGVGNRCFSHVEAARRTEKTPTALREADHDPCQRSGGVSRPSTSCAAADAVRGPTTR